MRLTVHVAEAIKDIVEVDTKNGVVNKKKIFNTLSFSNVGPDDVNQILSEIETGGLGTPVKHYLSGEKIPGIAKCKKK